MDEFLMRLEEWLTPDRVAMLIFMYNAAVQALPDPNGSKVYTWLYRFSHLLAANIRVTAKKFPGKTKEQIEDAEANTALVARLRELGDNAWLDENVQQEKA